MRKYQKNKKILQLKLTYIIVITFLFNCSNLLYSQRKHVMERKENDVTISEYIKTGKYILKDSNGQVLLQDLRGMRNLGGGYQAINSNNELIYFSINKGTIELKSDVNEIKYIDFTCGTVPNYQVSVKETLNHFEIILKTDNAMVNQEDTVDIIGQISKNDADDCFFINYEKVFSYENYPETNRLLNIKNENANSVIFKKNNLYGIFQKTEAIYSEIKIVNLITKIKKDNLYSYYEINNTPKYKELGNFVGVYARFELPNGKKGYLTGSGYEYMDE